MTTEPSPTRRDVELQLIRRAWTDAAFAQQLQENPRQAVEQETPTTLYLVAPPTPDRLHEGEPTDADLPKGVTR
jgi:hypothetical protein